MMKKKKAVNRVQDGKVTKPIQNNQININKLEKNLEPVFNSYILTLYRRKKYSLCINFIEKNLTEVTKKLRHYRILLAACHTMMANYKVAHEILDSVIETRTNDANNAFAYYNKGVAYYFEKKFRFCNLMFDMAIEADPSPLMDRARDMKTKVDLENRKAVIVLEKMTNEDITNLSNSSETKLTDKEIVEETKENSEQNTSSKNLENKLTNSMLLAAKNFPRIPEALPKSFVPKTSVDYYKKGRELFMSGSLQMASTSFLKSKELDPDYIEVEKMIDKVQNLINLSTESKTKFDQKDYENVVGITTKALALLDTFGFDSYFTNRKFYYQRGIALYHLGRHDESVKDYEELEKINKIINSEADDNSGL